MIIIRSRTLIYNCRYLLHHSAFNGQFFQWESRKCLAATSRGSPAKQARGCISVAKVPESLAALRQMHPPQSPAAPALPYGKATHYNLRVASLLRYSCHRLTTICASLRSFKLCSLVQLVFAATPVGESRFRLLPTQKDLFRGLFACCI